MRGARSSATLARSPENGPADQPPLRRFLVPDGGTDNLLSSDPWIKKKGVFDCAMGSFDGVNVAN